MTSRQTATSDTLKVILDAFNAHDLDAIMDFVADDGSFDTPTQSSQGAVR